MKDCHLLWGLYRKHKTVSPVTVFLRKTSQYIVLTDMMHLQILKRMAWSTTNWNFNFPAISSTVWQQTENTTSCMSDIVLVPWCCRLFTELVTFQQFMTILETVKPFLCLGLGQCTFAIHHHKYQQHFCHQFSHHWQNFMLAQCLKRSKHCTLLWDLTHYSNGNHTILQFIVDVMSGFQPTCHSIIFTSLLQLSEAITYYNKNRKAYSTRFPNMFFTILSPYWTLCSFTEDTDLWLQN